MVGIYFSGTGNTEHCVNEFLKCCDSEAKACAIENERAIQSIKEKEIIVFGYPI